MVIGTIALGINCQSNAEREAMPYNRQGHGKSSYEMSVGFSESQGSLFLELE